MYQYVFYIIITNNTVYWTIRCAIPVSLYILIYGYTAENTDKTR